MLKNIRPIHPFPARMAPELAWDELPDGGKPVRVLDPMVGSGTTLVAARLRGHEAIGFDRDPLAVLIASTWVANMDASKVERKAVEVLKRAKERATSIPTKRAYPDGADEETREFLDYWFDAQNRQQLTALAASIGGVRDVKVRQVLWCAFSRLIITKQSGVSLAMDISHSRPHRTRDVAPMNAFDHFLRSVRYITKIAAFGDANGEQPTARISNADARDLPLSASSIDIVITSPPYLNAIDYLRGHKFSLVWMGHSIADLRLLRSTNVGTEVSAKLSDGDVTTEAVISDMCSGAALPQRSFGMLRQYVRDLRGVLKECHRVLRKTGKGIFVVGDCNLRETFVANSTAIEIVAQEVGFKLQSTRRRPLPENRRYLPPPERKDAGAWLQKRMREEVILTFTKD